MKKIRIGVLGGANIAKRSIIPEIVRLNQHFELSGIASRDLIKANELAAMFTTSSYGSYEGLIDSEKLDALYIPLPNSMHYKYAKKALNKGIHVLVEKSLACSLDEVKELVDLAKTNNLLLMENFQFRFHSQLNYLKDFLDSKEIGEIRALKAVFCFPPFPDQDNIRYQKELGGGALLDAGAYTVKISSLLLGNQLKVEAASLITPPNHEVDIWGSAYLVDQTSGISSSCIFGFDHYYQCGIEVIGSKGKLSTNRLFTARDNYEPIYEIEVNGEKKQRIVLEKDNHFRNMLMAFYNKTSDDQAKEEENKQNLIQAALIQAIDEQSKRK